MKTEVSAGGLVLRYTREGWEVLLVRDMNNVWTFPKGLVEKNETIEATARREIREEVGLSALSMELKLPVISYTYKKDGLIRKSVHYFLFLISKPETVVPQTEEGLHDPTWVSIDSAIEQVGYVKTNVPLLNEAKQWTLRSHQT